MSLETLTETGGIKINVDKACCIQGDTQLKKSNSI